MVNDNLIFDLGVYDGKDSQLFLNLDYNVVGVECNPKKIQFLKNKFQDEILENKYFLETNCVSLNSNEIIKFYISNCEEWSSENKAIAERKYKATEIEVNSITLYDLIKKYGTPYYCKIDIEGNDYKALLSLKKLNYNDLPKFISCESECLGSVKSKDDDYLKNLNILYDLGYRKFALFSNSKYLVNDDPITKYPFIPVLDCNFNDWKDYDYIKNRILSSNERLIINYNFWYDIFAKKS